MRVLYRLGLAALVALGATARIVPADADNVVARWIQLGPGSSASALSNGSYGDQPLSATPTILARAIISGGSCPALMVDGTLSITMNQRFVASQLTSLTNSAASYTDPYITPALGASSNSNGKAGYPAYFVNSSVTSPRNLPDGTAQATTSWGECEAVIPAGHTTASINGVNLKLPIANPQRILVIGDTGCRMSGTAQQACHTSTTPSGYTLAPAGFPFGALANYEAQFQPDLILHVGDYFYRDTNCYYSGTTEAVPGCSNTTNSNYEVWGDTFDSWNADFFYPGNTLLQTAPWVMARGNHESCGRGARGWFALLDPHPYNFNQVNCLGGSGLAQVTNQAVYSGDFTPTYIVPAGGVNLIVFDSSFANDSGVDTNLAANFDYDLTAALNSLPTNSYSIYMTHKPSYGLVSGAPNNGGDFTEQYTFSGNATAGSAFSGGMVPYKIAMFLSGHIHQFEYVNFGDYTHYAPQLVVGVGGDNLDPTANPNGTSPTYAYQSQSFTVHQNSTTTNTSSTTVNHAYSQAEFGFALLQATATGYIANVYNTNATKAGRCTITLSPRNITCWD